MIGNVHQLASYTRINGSGTGNYLSATMLTRDTNNNEIGFYGIIHSITDTCPTSPSATVWIEKGVSEDLPFIIPVGTDSYAITNSTTAHIFSFANSVMMPYTKFCVGLSSATPSVYLSLYAFYQDESV